MDRFLWLKSVIFNPIKPIYDEYKPQSSQRAQSPHERFFGLSGTVLTFARPLWSLCSLWLNSVYRSPINPKIQRLRSTMTIAIILGTRPEIIKMAPVIRECQRRGLDHFVLHTGQHYSYEMDRVFFEQLKFPPAEYNLEAGSGTHARPDAIWSQESKATFA